MLTRILLFMLALACGLVLVQLFLRQTATVAVAPVAIPKLCECRPARIISRPKRHRLTDKYKTEFIVKIGADGKVIALHSPDLVSIMEGYADDWVEVLAIKQAMKEVEALEIAPAYCGYGLVDSVVRLEYKFSNGSVALTQTIKYSPFNEDDFKDSYTHPLKNWTR